MSNVGNGARRAWFKALDLGRARGQLEPAPTLSRPLLPHEAKEYEAWMRWHVDAFIDARGDEALGSTWSFLDITPYGRQEEWEDSPEGWPQTPPYTWGGWHD